MTKIARESLKHSAFWGPSKPTLVFMDLLLNNNQEMCVYSNAVQLKTFLNARNLQALTYKSVSVWYDYSTLYRLYPISNVIFIEWSIAPKIYIHFICWWVKKAQRFTHPHLSITLRYHDHKLPRTKVNHECNYTANIILICVCDVLKNKFLFSLEAIFSHNEHHTMYSLRSCELNISLYSFVII